MPKLSIIIVNWNTAKLLGGCLKSLEFEIRNLKFETEIIVVDNGSTDNSVEMVKDYFKKYSCEFVSGTEKMSKKEELHVPPIRVNLCNPTVKLIENRANLGFAKGNNIGIKQAKGEYIMLLNSDTIIQKGSIEKLVEFLDNHPEIDIVGPKLLNPDGTPQPSCGSFPSLWVSFIMLFKEHFGGSDIVRFSPDNSVQVDWLMGAAFISRKTVFEEIGGFDERMFMYMEEVEWFYRARKNHHLAYFDIDAEIVHLGRGSSKSGKKEPIINIYKGLLHFYKVHKTPLEVFLLLIMLKFKAILSFAFGILKNDQYLKETYGQAYKIS